MMEEPVILGRKVLVYDNEDANSEYINIRTPNSPIIWGLY